MVLVRRSRGKTPPSGQRWLTPSECADRLALTVRQLQNEVDAGMPSEGEGRMRRFPWPDVRIWRDERIRTLAKQDARPTNATDSRNRREAAEAELAELKLAREREEVVPVEAFRAHLEAAFSRVRARLLALPPKLGAHGVGHRTPREAQAALAPLVHEAMQELSDANDVPSGLSEEADAA